MDNEDVAEQRAQCCAHRSPRLSFRGPVLLLFRVGAGGLAGVEDVAVGVVERGGQRLLTVAPQAPPHPHARAPPAQLLQGGDDGHGLAVVEGRDPSVVSVASTSTRTPADGTATGARRPSASSRAENSNGSGAPSCAPASTGAALLLTAAR